MTIDYLEKLVDSKLKNNTRVPKAVRLMIASVLHTAYLIGKDGADAVPIPSELSDEDMISKFLENNDVTVIEPSHIEDGSQTSQMRLD